MRSPGPGVARVLKPYGFDPDRDGDIQGFFDRLEEGGHRRALSGAKRALRRFAAKQLAQRAEARERQAVKAESAAAWTETVFDSKTGLMPGRVADLVLEQGPIKKDAGGEFMVYEEGVWRAGEETVARRIQDIIGGDLYRPGHEMAAAKWLRTRIPYLNEMVDSNFINVKNGMLRVSDMELLEHGPEYDSTIQYPVRWDRSAKCPRTELFLEEVLHEDSIAYGKEVLGYMFLPGNPLHRWFICYGGGSNGKSLFAEMVRAVVGAGNCSAVPLEDLVRDRFATSDLYGKQLNISTDIEAGYLMHTAVIKSITGEDHVRAQRKGGRAFQFKSQVTCLFSANQLPTSSDPSAGFNRRVAILEFPNSFRAGGGRELVRAFEKEAEGVLVMGVVSVRRMLRRGDFLRPASVLGTHREFVEGQNPVLPFLAACTRKRQGEGVPGREVFDRYRVWCDDEAIQERYRLGKKQFYKLAAHGTEVVRDGDETVRFPGIRLFRGRG